MKTRSRRLKNRSESNKRRFVKSKITSTELANKMLVARWIKFRVASGILASQPGTGNRPGSKHKRNQEARHKAKVLREEEVVEGADLQGDEGAEVVAEEMESQLTQQMAQRPHLVLRSQQKKRVFEDVEE